MTRARTLIIFSAVMLILCSCGNDDSGITGPRRSGVLSQTTSALKANGNSAIACWNFNEGNGSTAEDGCSSHDGTVFGATWVSGVCGSAMEFDGDDDNQEYVAMSEGYWLNQPKGTVEAWVKIHPDNLGGRFISNETYGYQDGLHMGYGTETSQGVILNGGIYCGIHSSEGGGHYAEVYIDDVEKDRWHFVAFVWDADANSLMLFIDGNASTDISPHLGIVDTGEPLTIGCWENGDERGGWFKGAVDEIRFYDRALTIDELNAHYEQACVQLDIKPGSCPNPINPKSKGVLPAAILGSAQLDVHDVDISSLLLEGVAPVRSNIEDVSTLVADGNECDCTEQGADGFDDLTLKFKTQEILSALGAVGLGDVVELTLTGALLDGTTFEASDCVVIVGGARSFGYEHH